MSGTREPVRSKADGNGTQAATNAPVKEASVVFVSVRLPPLTLPLSLELEFQRARSSPRSDHRGTSRVPVPVCLRQECRGKCQFVF